jgi:hypothetical protein
MAVSGNPQTFTEGALLDDVDARIAKVRTNLFTYEGTSTTVPAACVTFLYGPNRDQEYVQQYSAGDIRDFVPDGPEGGTGTGFNAVGERGVLSKGSNWGRFLLSLAANGFPVERLDPGDFSVLEGTDVHLLREVQKTFTGSRSAAPNKEQKDDGPAAAGGPKPKEKDRTILLVSAIHALPGAQPGTGTATATKPTATAGAKKAPTPPATKPAPASHPTPAHTATPAPATAVAEAPTETADQDEALRGVLLGILGEAGDKGLKKKELVPKVYTAITNDAIFRNWAAKRVVMDDFLSTGPWTYDNGVVTLG